MINDIVADSLARIKNAITRGHDSVELRYSSLMHEVCNILVESGYIAEVEKAKAENNFLSLKLTINGDKQINSVSRISKPGQRIYRGYKQILPVKDGKGLLILSTSKGVMSGNKARKLKVGGEIICEIS